MSRTAPPISGFTFVRNGTELGYPYLESMRSMLGIVDELVVNVGDSTDDTLERIRSFAHEAEIPVRLVESVWDPELRSGGRILAQQTNIALDACSHDWCLYLQADEVLHEQDAPVIRAAVAAADAADQDVEGLLFAYRHFYGSYHTVGTDRRWYRHEVRVVRRSSGIRSWKDAQGFRVGDRKPRVWEIPATVHHYGHVRPPAVMRRKKRAFEHWWSADKKEPVTVPESWDYDRRRRVRLFRGSHPAVMTEFIARQDWAFEPDTRLWAWVFRSPREAASAAIEALTGWRIGEYRNYRRIGRFPVG